jgi:hypothetical protein
MGWFAYSKDTNAFSIMDKFWVLYLKGSGSRDRIERCSRKVIVLGLINRNLCRFLNFGAAPLMKYCAVKVKTNWKNDTAVIGEFYQITVYQHPSLLKNAESISESQSDVLIFTPTISMNKQSILEC